MSALIFGGGKVFDHPFVIVTAGILVALMLDGVIASVATPVLSGFGVAYSVS